LVALDWNAVQSPRWPA